MSQRFVATIYLKTRTNRLRQDFNTFHNYGNQHQSKENFRRGQVPGFYRYRVHTRASSKIFRLFAEIDLFENGSELAVLTIKKRFSLFKAKYNITLLDGLTIEFKTASFWKGLYRCDHGADRYDIYRHNGRKCSIYYNDRQIVWWDKKAVTWFNGDNYTIVADRHCNKNLVIAFCLILDNYKSEGEKSTVNIDIGRICPQAKKFDKYWAPAE